ncbi:GGDEF domain-containing protein [Bacillus daqingensis]|uniref:GGDEF domain-containing protein n=1 Tax=Bacillus daqingensis TaxID=872396 RepID=A0ABV9NTS2_9BACI
MPFVKEAPKHHQLLIQHDFTQIIFSAWVTHFIMIFVFIIYTVPSLIVLNALSLALLTTMFFFNMMKRPLTTFLIMFSQTSLHVLYGSFLLGWSVGFFYYLFIFPILALLILKKSQMVLLISVIMLQFLFVYFITPEYTALLPELSQRVLGAINLFGVLIIVTFVFYLFKATNDDILDELHDQSIHDELTGLLNRRKMTAVLEDEVERGRNGMVLLLDMDDFKRINDTYGHDVGDKVLIMAAGVFRSGLPAGAKAARWGGEEFLIYLPDTEKEEVEPLFQKLLVQFRSKSPDLPLSFTGGASPLLTSVYETLRASDRALYHGKALGKERLENYASEKSSS